MDDIEARTAREQAALKGSIRLLVVLAGISFAAGLLTGSFAVLFDGFYALIDASMGGLALLVSRLIQEDIRRQGTPARGRVRYQFGFWHLEPLVLALNSIMLVLVVLYALGSALLLLLDGGSEPDFGWAALYAGSMALACLVMGWRQRRLNRDLKSAFVALDAKSWAMSGAISAALFLAFLVALALTGTRHAWLQPFVDPAILVAVCLSVLPMPLSDLRAALSDVFLLAPEELDRHVRARAAEAVKRHGFETSYSYVAKMGRSVLIEIHFLVPPDWPAHSIAELDAIRDEVGAAIGGDGPGRWLTICFTEDPDWAF